ncbi:MAG: hypothetical protein UU95_C0015G0011 [Parcubacteria group bacterium GW2011_GWC2_42_12]|nr:MAG: hypothetical protein UU95_C0015G0011 [Parcubacteria group bacterium GW2011_GWC2_42_12]
MDIVIDLQPILEFLSLPPEQLALGLFYYVGWIPIAITFVWGVSTVWLRYIRLAYGASVKTVLLAVDIPRGNAQTPRAVENIFAYLAGAHATQDLYEKWWLGEWQLYFSFEIVSIEGYIQFLIWAPEKYRYLIDAAIYSQYPDAEITEVNDYTEGIPTQYPDDQYDIFGGEFRLVEDSVYPIKTYEHFEHMMGEPETQYKDPMAALMDLMGSLKKGEQLWYQILVIPIGSEWNQRGEDEIKRIIGEKSGKKNYVDRMTDGLLKIIHDLSEMIYQLWGDIEDKKEDKENQFKMMNLKPRQKKQVEEIQEKVGKLGFAVKIRYAYVARKEVINKNKVSYGFTGYMKQFNYNDLNSYKPDIGDRGTITRLKYEKIFGKYRLNLRKNKLILAYKYRSDIRGRLPHILNTEELASIWHFPVEASVKSPLIQKAPGRKAEPPSSLPVAQRGAAEELAYGGKFKSDIFSLEDKGYGFKPQVAVRHEPPGNLPIV